MVPLLLAGLLATSAASAQHTPLIERMADAPASATATTHPETSATTATPLGHNPVQAVTTQRPQIGDTTRALLRLQADGNNAGNALPMLGETASRSYQRYLNSFDHPIPEYFEATLPSSKQGGSSR